MTDRILTSHAGSLPRPEDLVALNSQPTRVTSRARRSSAAGYARRSRTWSRQRITGMA